MRWRLLILPVLLMAFQATIARAQVPVTMSMLAEGDHHPADAVEFYDSEGNFLGSAEERPDSYQKTVGIISAGEDGRYSLLAKLIIGGSSHDYPFSFGAADHCTEEPHTGEILRIACSLVRFGGGMVCSAVYEGMKDPPDECGSQQCVLCGNVRVCGSEPAC